MHIGTLRTVLYDYFLARQSGGQFVLRIEDTDQERSVPGAIESLLKTFQTLGLDYDEGLVLNQDGSLGEKGPYGPYIQSKRLDIYRTYADQLVVQGDAYHCFCTSEELEKMREGQALLKLAPKYDRRCLKLSAEEVSQRLARGDRHVLRLRVPEGESKFVDAIRGEIVFKNSEVDDQVLMKSDGFPTYHLAVVVDDELMKITHVLRGEEWISSTPKQIILCKMLGFEMPIYAHVPLLLNPDKTKLSKRKGDVSVESYLSKGYLPEALINFLALLGWNPTDDREVFSRDELIKLFDLSKVNRAGAVLNLEKLNWVNAHYLKTMPEADYLKLMRPFIQALSDDSSFVDRVCLLVRERVQLPDQIVEMTGFLFPSNLNHEANILVWKTQTKEEARERLEAVKALLTANSQAFASISELDVLVRGLIAEKGWGNGDTLWPLRVALSGMKQSPSPFELLWVYGKERAFTRIDEALKILL
ncbi:glutamate--tRNA ligase [Patescibacteria group bacterium]|nr:glutamate--tRNA ligase [Patescibacteria group bacterium]